MVSAKDKKRIKKMSNTHTHTHTHTEIIRHIRKKMLTS